MKKRLFSERVKGQAFMELAISMTFLLVLTAGALDLGRLFFTYTAIRDAVQEGASFLAMEPVKCNEAIQRIRTHTTEPIDLAETIVSIDLEIDSHVCTEPPDAWVSDICPGDDISVTLNYDSFVFAMPFFAGATLPLEVSVTGSVLVDPLLNSDPTQPAHCP